MDTACRNDAFPIAPKKETPGGEETGGNGGKDSAKENRQGCLSRLIRARADRLQKRCVPHCSKKRDALRRLFFWSRQRESNPPPRLGKPLFYR